ncbi:MAG TPA: helix-turn-helix transcriptional regulator [Acidimicrobiales bacterium]|nr:helix-turn-helix transcriptional regulator [Acidimicrobiales bacterium]
MYGAFLRRVRESRGLSQAQLAELTGISQPNLSAYENDRRTPTLDTFNRMLVACGYQVAADGGSTVLHLPLPPGAGGYPFDDLPPRLPDDPPDEAPVLPPDATPATRAWALAQVLDLSQAMEGR